MESKQTPRFLTVDGAARLVGLTHWTIRRWLQTGRLARYKSGQRTVVLRTELLELFETKKGRAVMNFEFAVGLERPSGNGRRVRESTRPFPRRPKQVLATACNCAVPR